MAEFAEQLTTEQRLERRLRELSEEQENETKTDNNFTDTLKNKLDAIESQANNYSLTYLEANDNEINLGS